MKRIDNINNIFQKCTGCMACSDVCPSKSISPIVDDDGFLRVKVDEDKCIGCGVCFNVCPAQNRFKNTGEQHLFAAYSLDSAVQSRGSSGGMFELLASRCIEKGYYVCGAAFDGLKLKHKLVNTKNDLRSLLKSKYIQSNTNGIYSKVTELLKNGEKVFFCGTPCQVSALSNILTDSLKENLFTADIVCHGVPSQKVFDMYVKALEKKHGGKIRDFSFRVKNNRYKHAHGYSYKLEKNGKTTQINGIYTQSSFYNAFKDYLIFRESCYDCQYSTLERVSDITLADFWGIEKYDFNGNTDAGVSMIITNTAKGKKMFDGIRTMIVSKEFPLQYGIESNHCLTHSTVKPKIRDVVLECIQKRGYEATAKKYFKEGFIHNLYWLMPAKIRNFVRRLRR